MGTERNFSPAFFADLYIDMGIVLVLNLDGSEYPREAFERRGIAVCSLFDPGAAEETRPFSLQVLDRFMTLVEGAGGGVAVHCNGRLGYAAVLIAVYMLRKRLFLEPRDALSWVYLARGQAVAIDPSCFQLSRLPAIGASP